MQGARRVCSLLVGLVLSCIGGPQARAPVAELPVRVSPARALPNGLRLVVEEVGDPKSGGAVLIVAAGAADEVAGQEGLAHLVEHLVFQARHGDGGDVHARLSRLSGGYFNGSTSWDATQYWAYAPDSDMVELLGIFAAMLRDPLAGVTEEEFQREKRVVQAERRLRTENGTPGQSLGHLAVSVFPEGHSYAHPVVGSESSLSSLTLENARAFAGTYYRPDRATLALAGYGADAQSRRVDAAWGLDPNAPPSSPQQRPQPRKLAAPPAGTATIPSHEAMVPSSTLWIGWPVPPGYGRDGAVPLLLADMISNAFHRDAGARDEGVSSVRAQLWPGLLASMFFLEVTLREGSDPEHIKELVIERMRNNFIGQTAELARYRRWVQVRNTYAEEDWQTRLRIVALSTHFTGEPDLLSQRSRSIDALSEAQVDGYFARYLTPGRARAILTVPMKSGPRVIPASTPLAPLGAAMSSASMPESNSRHEPVPPGPSPKLTADAFTPLWAGWAGKGTLDNGLTFVALDRPGARYHTVLLGFSGGGAAAELPGVTTAEAWARISDDYDPSAAGLAYSAWHGADATIEQLRSTGSDVRLTLSQLRRELGGNQISWPPRHFLAQLETFQRAAEAPDSRLERERHHLLFGDHPYGFYATPEQVHAVRPGHIHHFRGATRRPENALLVIVGDIEPDEIKTLVAEELESWNAQAKKLPPVALPPPLALEATGPKLLSRGWPGRTQVELVYGCVLNIESQLETAALELYAELLGLELTAQLRERTGATYSVSSRPTLLRGNIGALEVRADVAYEALPVALSFVPGLIDDLQRLDPLSIEAARSQLARRHNLRHTTTVDTAQTLFNYWNRGIPWNEIDEFATHRVTAQRADVQRIAARCRSRSVLSVLGDERGMAPALGAVPWPRVHASE